MDGVTTRQVAVLTSGQCEELAALLVAVVAEGASVGFLPPLTLDDALAYWHGVTRPGVILLIAEREGRIVGAGQLDLSMRPNGRNRAEVCKVLVHPQEQGRGIGKSIMRALETAACREGRRLLHLDTNAGDKANRLYRSMGYIEAGTIPDWATGADGTLHATTFYYKVLDGLEPDDGQGAAPGTERAVSPAAS